MEHEILLSERLKGLMQVKGLNTVQLEKETGLTNQAISNWLRGASVASVQALWILADYFVCTIDYLVGREKE